jgi:hypothetical protein
MARSNNFATKEFRHVILSVAKDLGKLGRFFAALRMTDRALRCSSFGTGHRCQRCRRATGVSPGDQLSQTGVMELISETRPKTVTVHRGNVILSAAKDLGRMNGRARSFAALRMTGTLPGCERLPTTYSTLRFVPCVVQGLIFQRGRRLLSAGAERGEGLGGKHEP